MRRPLILIGLVLAAWLIASTVQAVDATAKVAGESINIIVYVFLGIAMIGWTYFFGLVGAAILHVVRRSRTSYTPEQPLKCK